MSSDDALAVERRVRSLYTAIETGDLDLMGAVWADSDDVVCIHPGWPVVRGRSAMLRSWAVVMAGTPYVQFFLTDLVVDAKGDTAVVTCAESLLTGAEGSAEGFMGARAVSTKVLVRTSTGWRVTLHHSSPVMAGPGAGEPSASEGSAGEPEDI